MLRVRLNFSNGVNNRKPSLYFWSLNVYLLHATAKSDSLLEDVGEFGRQTVQSRWSFTVSRATENKLMSIVDRAQSNSLHLTNEGNTYTHKQTDSMTAQATGGRNESRLESWTWPVEAHRRTRRCADRPRLCGSHYVPVLTSTW